MADVVLGVNNGFALKRWPEPEAWAEIVHQELGLREVQLSFDLLDPAWPAPCVRQLCQRVVAAAATHDLHIPSTFTGLVAYAQNLLAHPEPDVRDQAAGWFASALQVTAMVRADSTGGHWGAFSVRDHADRDRRPALHRELIGRVQGLAVQAKELGLASLLWEPMPVPREMPHTIDEAVAMLAEVNDGTGVPIRLCLDLGHCCAEDVAPSGDPHAWLEQLLPWTDVVHLQQTDGRGDHHWPFTRAFAGSGIVDPVRVLEIARRSSRPTVHLFLEICHPHETPDRRVLDDLKESVDTWVRAGARIR
jgi:hypothetical protein